MQPSDSAPSGVAAPDVAALPELTPMRVVRNVGADGLYVRCRPVDPKRWWRPDGVVGWVDELTETGARLRLHPSPEARRRARWVLRVGRLEGEVEIERVTALEVGLQGITIDVRFVQLQPQLHRLIVDYLAGTRTAADWIRTLRAPL